MTEQELLGTLRAHLIGMADTLMVYHNPCDLQGGSCRAGAQNPCCINSMFGPGVCPHWCGRCVNPNVDCKLWICDTAVQVADPRFVEALVHLEQFAKIYGLVRSPLIGEQYTGADKQPA